MNANNSFKSLTVSVFFMMLALVAPNVAFAGSFADVLGGYLANREAAKQQGIKGEMTRGLVQAFSEQGQFQPRGIEQTPEWQQIFKMAEGVSHQIDQDLINAGQRFDFCSIQSVRHQMEENPKAFEFNYNSKLPRQTAIPSDIFNYSTYGELTRFNAKYTGMEPIHIPSVNAINLGMSFRNDKNSLQNASAIMLPKSLVNEIKRQYNMTGRNPVIDGQDMYVSTLRDISTIGYLIIKNPQLNVDFDGFFISSMLIYTRNKLLCLYDKQ